MDCKTAAPLFEDFRDEALDAATEAALRNHLSECESCRQALREMDTFDQRLTGAMALIRPSDEFAARMKTAIQLAGQPEPPRQVEWLRPVVLAAAACALISIGIWFVTIPEPEPVEEKPHEVVTIFHHNQVPSPTQSVKPKQRMKPKQPVKVAKRTKPKAPPKRTKPVRHKKRPALERYGIGEAFVIGDGDTEPYRGRTFIRVVRVVDGTPELLVDAFPEG